MRYLIAILIAPFLAAQTPDLPVEQTKKNIKVLTGVPSSQLIPTMAFMANSLGVTCANCHAQAYESDEKPAKDAARRMIALQRELNAKYYDGKTVVTCNTCHQGRVTPAATPDLANAGWNRLSAPARVTPLEPAVQLLPKNPEGTDFPCGARNSRDRVVASGEGDARACDLPSDSSDRQAPQRVMDDR